MPIPKEFLRLDKIRAICIIKNLKTDEIYLYKTEDAVKSYKKHIQLSDLSFSLQRQKEKQMKMKIWRLFLKREKNTTWTKVILSTTK